MEAIYDVSHGLIICGDTSIRRKDLELYNVIAPFKAAADDSVQTEPTANVQTWGYDNLTGVLILLADYQYPISKALELIDDSELPTTVNRHAYSTYKTYFEDRQLRITNEPSIFSYYDENEAEWNPGQELIRKYIEQGYLWVPDIETWKSLQEKITDENYFFLVPFQQCVVLAISEVEERWTGRPSIDEINIPAETLPDVAYPPSIIRRTIEYCLYGGPILIAGWPSRWLLTFASFPFPIDWFHRALWVGIGQMAYQGWKRYQLYQFEARMFREDTVLIHDEALVNLERKRLRDERDLHPMGDLKKREQALNAKSERVFFLRKQLELRKRNFYIVNKHRMGAKKRKAINAMLLSQ